MQKDGFSEATLVETVPGPVGVDAAFPLEDFDGDLEYWATNIVEILSEPHREAVQRVKNNHPEPGCKRCGTKGCPRCDWRKVETCHDHLPPPPPPPTTTTFSKAVRYWRNLETQGRAEGYADAAKTNVMRRGKSAHL